MRDEATYKRRALLPSSIVLFSLLSLVLAPLLVQHRIDGLRTEITDWAEPARDLVTEIQLALALEAASTRAFLLTGRQEYAAAHREAHLRRNRAFEQLVPMGRRLGVSVNAEIASLARNLEPADSLLNALYSGRLSATAFIEHLDEQQLRFESAAGAAARIDRAIARTTAARTADIRATARFGTALMSVLVVVAVSAALVVARLGIQLHALAVRLDVRARQQTDLREIAQGLSAAVSVQELVGAITGRIVALTRASGAYVERIVSRESGSEVEIVAAAGVHMPRVGTRVPLAASFSERAIASGEPEIIPALEPAGETIAPYLGNACRGCSAVVVPLSSERTMLGSLVLLRRSDQEPFDPDDAPYVDVVGDLVSAAVRRVLLLESEREARGQVTTILESITDAFFAVDGNWCFTYVNREAERLLRKSRDELIGRTLWDEFPGSAGSRFEHEYVQAIAEQKAVHFEEYSPPLRVWVDVRAYPSGDGLSVYFLDITARKNAEEKMRESERNFRALANSIPQMAWMADAAGRTLWYNDRWYEYTGSAKEEMIGFGWQMLLPAEAVQRVSEQFAHSIRSGEPWEDIYPLRSRTGEYRWFLSRALPIRDQTGNIVRWFGTNTDITESIEAAAERERLLEREQEARAESELRRTELERVTESRARLMRGFSHDVKNPLGAADGYLQLLEEGIMDPLTEKQQGSIAKVRRSLRAALDLIEDLLELARAESGALQIEPAPTVLREVALEAAEEYRAQAEARGLTLSVDFADELPVIQSDAPRIRQVIGNLLSNAVKYTQRGSVTLNASVTAGPDAPGPGRWMAIAVTDTGPGISEAQQRALFQEFRRLDSAGTEKGTGIGLAISQRIARALGGIITVESQLGRGSVFTLWLPLDQRS